MRRFGGSLSAESAGRERIGEDTPGENVRNNNSSTYMSGNSHGGNIVPLDNNNRLARRQARCAQHRQRSQIDALRTRVRNFSVTSKATLSKARPTNAELRTFIEQEFSPVTKSSLRQKFCERAHEISAAEMKQLEIMRSIDKEDASKGHGWVPLDKPDGTTRLIFENWNSIKYWSERKTKVDINVIEATRKRYNADILAGVEHQTNFSKAEDDAQFHDIFGFGEDRKSVEAHNIHNGDHRSAYGGTAIMVFGRLSNYATNHHDRDPTGLGRWCSKLIKSGSKSVRIVSAYRPNKGRWSGRRQGAGGVWRQHLRYFRGQNRQGNPRALFDQDLCAALKTWRRDGEDIILAGDFNDNIYTSSLAQSLGHRDIGLVEQYHRLYDEPAPFSHNTGSTPIMGVYATAGVEVTAAYLSRHHAKGVVGDHRLHVFDFSTKSITGLDSPTDTRTEGRNLQCSHHYAKTNYVRVLMQLTQRHKMFSKALRLRRQRMVMTAAEFQLVCNKYDKEFIELMLAAEKRCRNKKPDFLAWSPIVGACVRHLHLYRWILRYKHGGNTNTSNLKRACESQGLPNPIQMTLAEAEIAELTCLRRLDKLRDEAPQLRLEHLQSCIDQARAVNDETKVDALVRIMRRERDRRQNRRLYCSFGKKKGKPPSQIAVRCPTGPDPIFSGQERIEAVAAEHLTNRYRSAHSSPFASGRLLDDVGHHGQGPEVAAILAGTYEFPSEYSPEAKQICIEAAKIFSSTSESMISTYITRDDFQSWWLHAREETQSSKSGGHFGHYKAAAENDYLSALHVAKLNLALETGVPYERWGHGLTVLLEKEFGSIYIDKLRAICLFEADFNWLQKIIFAKRMISCARQKQVIPAEQCATPGIDQNQGSMLKIYHCDTHLALRIPYSVVSADLANCYDAVNHAVAALALLSFGLPHMAVKLVLTCLQSMYFWLRTAFGISGTPFHGTLIDPFFGISQGGGIAPPTFQAVSALMINSYKSFGHGVKFVSPVTGLIFFFAAILYVDDTDLLLCADSPTMSDVDFFAKIQRSVTAWAKIVVVTGGSLKASKCHASVASFKFVQGKARMKKTSALPDVPITIDDQDGTQTIIKLIEPTTSKKTLGVLTNLAGKSKAQLEYTRDLGLEWATKLNTNKYISPSDGWKSLVTQLKPKVTWGIVCLTAKPEKVARVQAAIYHRSLSRLRVHKSIRRELRTMPEMFQGLGMFDLNVERLGQKVFFLRRHWNTPTAMGKMLKVAFETFQIDVGLDGNIFTRAFDHFSPLATHGWFFDLWRLCSHFDVSLIIHEENDIPLVRERDKGLMDCFVDLGVFSTNQLCILARFRKFFAVHSIAELLCCDGSTVRKDVLSYQRGSSTRVFPFEKPLRRDLDLWIGALKLVTSPTLTLDRPLGAYLIMPPRHDGWFATADRMEVYCVLDASTFDVYTCATTAHRRRRPIYAWERTATGQPDEMPLLASVEESDGWQVTLLSTAPVPRVPDETQTFLQTLYSWPNQSLWKYFKCDGDGEWIGRAISNNTLSFVHDGSYMRQVAPKLCSAAFVLSCSRTGFQASGTLVERCDSADNYRAEALGAAAGLLVIKAATSKRRRYLSILKAHCDNMGIVKHGNAAESSCPDRQVQADLITLIKKIIRGLPCQLQYEHVFGHQDEILRWDQLSLPEKLNVLCDSLAKRALMAGIVNRDYITNTFPFEDIILQCSNKKVVGQPTKAIYQWWGYKTARAFFHSKKIVNEAHFDLIYWEGMGKAMNMFPIMFRRWITKHVSGCCGVNEHLSKYTPGLVNECLACGALHETTAHITVCDDPERSRLYKSSVDDIVTWMQKNKTAPLLAQLIEDYLLARGSKTMDQIAPENIGSDYKIFVKYHDILGWQNFIEGRFLTYMVQIQREYLADQDTFRTAESWARGLIEQLLRLTHRQWLLRNALLHFRLSDGRTYVERERLVERILELMWTDPDDLLPMDRALMSEDFTKLAKADAGDQAYWIAETEVAIRAAEHAYQRDNTDRPDTGDRHNADTTRESREELEPEIDTEGSMRYRRRRRR